MALVQPVPEGSIYVWCYKQGLRGVSWEEILSALAVHGVQPRGKDKRNWEDGMKKHLGKEYVREAQGLKTSSLLIDKREDPRIIKDLSEYSPLNCNSEMYEQTRWVPCSKANKPLVAWSEIRCTLDEARLWPGAHYLAENLKGCRWIVLDFDVDHDPDDIDLGLREFGKNLLKEYPTAALYKPDWMGFHLTYWTELDIPTKHLPHVKIDICGNSMVGTLGEGTSGQLRYLKNKLSNDVDKVGRLTDEVWSKIQAYSLTKDIYRKVRNNESI